MRCLRGCKHELREVKERTCASRGGVCRTRVNLDLDAAPRCQNGTRMAKSALLPRTSVRTAPKHSPTVFLPLAHSDRREEALSVSANACDSTLGHMWPWITAQDACGPPTLGGLLQNYASSAGYRALPQDVRITRCGALHYNSPPGKSESEKAWATTSLDMRPAK